MSECFVPSDIFFMAIEKIIGTETEYGITTKNDVEFDAIAHSMLLVNSYQQDPTVKIIWDYDQENPLVDARGFKVERKIEAPREKDNAAINKVLDNGARYYVDHAHPEFSTPECSNARDLVKYEKAGEWIVNASRIQANQLIPTGEEILIYKNNSDRKGNSYGYHENYLMDRKTPFELIVTHLTPFLISRQVFTGAGKVGFENDSDPVDYQISQRADFFETEIGLDTMVKRPIINTRDEPHADREKYRRLHVIVGDSNMSEVTTYLKVGTTALILKMIEDKFIDKDLTLRNPVKALRDISHDITCKKKVQLDNGKKFTAIQIQKEYLELAKKYASQQEKNPITEDILTRWERVLTKLEEEPDQLNREIDWVIKKYLITNYMKSRGCNWTDSKVLMMDLQYHDIRPEKGLYYLLQKQGGVERILKDEEILEAVQNPPIDTRAYFRGSCLRKYRSEIFGVSWSALSFSVDEVSIKRVLMSEPAKGSKAHVHELLERSATAKELLKNLAA
jgi:proteasome accessory factor A